MRVKGGRWKSPSAQITHVVGRFMGWGRGLGGGEPG